MVYFVIFFRVVWMFYFNFLSYGNGYLCMDRGVKIIIVRKRMLGLNIFKFNLFGWYFFVGVYVIFVEFF